MKFRWKGRARFAEAAEALDVDAEQIMAVQDGPGSGMRVVYTTGGEQVWVCYLMRNRDKILHLVGRPVEVNVALTDIKKQLKGIE